MKTDKDLAEDVTAGLNAESVLNNTQYQGAFLSIKAKLINAFVDSKYEDSADRDETWRKLQALQWVEDELKRAIQNGNFSNKKLETNTKLQ
jgi:hypothetical protein